MPLLQSRRLLLGLALALLWPDSAFGQAPGTLSPKAAPPQVQIKTTPTAGYHWHTLVLRRAVPSDILALMHWNETPTPLTPAPFQALPPANLAPDAGALPEGVLRIYALQSTNSLLVEATEAGFASVIKLVQVFDRAPKQVQFKTLLVAVPAARAGLDAPDTEAAPFLTKLLGGESRVIGTPTVTTTDGVSATVSISYCPALVSPLGGRLRLVQSGPSPSDSDPSTRYDLRLTPRMTSDGTLTLNLAFAGLPVSADRPLRSGVMAVYELPNPQTASGERLFFFLQPTLFSKTDSAGGLSVTVTP